MSLRTFLPRATRGIVALSLLGGGAVTAQSTPGTLTYRGAGGAILGQNYTTFALDGNPAVPLGGISAFTLRLEGLTYQNGSSGDLRAYLLFDGVGTMDNGVAVAAFGIGAPPGGGGYLQRDLAGTYTFGTSFVRPFVAGPTGAVAPGEYAFAGDAAAILARIGNLGGVGAPGRIHLVFNDEWAFNGSGRLDGFEISVTTTPSSTVPEPGTWALLATGLAGVGGVRMRRRAR